MANSEMNLIKKRINGLPTGSAFVVSVFTDIAGYDNAKKCLQRLEHDGEIRRVIRGIYDKPCFLKLLNEYSSPHINEVANAIARNYNWQIAPIGLTALNLLGLSTQVVNSYEYFSSGQYKTYQIGKITISFKHKSSKELLNLSFKSLLVVQAIKELGTDLTEKQIAKISDNLSSKEKSDLLNEACGVTKWIYEIIKKICNKENQKCLTY